MKMMRDFARVVYEDEERKYYVYRPDCPGDEYHEITLGAAVDLGRQLQRYQSDAWNEKHNKLSLSK